MTKKKQIDWRIVCTGIVGIVVLECAALMNGINGTMFSVVLAIIAGTIGITLPTPNIKH